MPLLEITPGRPAHGEVGRRLGLDQGLNEQDDTGDDEERNPPELPQRQPDLPSVSRLLSSFLGAIVAMACHGATVGTPEGGHKAHRRLLAPPCGQRSAGVGGRSVGPFSELQDRRRDQVSRGRSLRVMKISRSLQDCLGTCAHRGAGVLGNEINAQPSDNGVRVVFVQTVKGKAVVEQRRRLMEHLTSQLEIHFRACPGYCRCGRQELIEGWIFGAAQHATSLATRARAGK